jgi:hypothetical protein
MSEQTLRKELSRKVVGDREIIENEIHKIDNFVTGEEVETLNDILGDDYEAAWDAGLCYNMDEELYSIDIRKFTDWAGNYLESNEEDDNDDDRPINYQFIKDIKKKLEQYQDFDIWM